MKELSVSREMAASADAVWAIMTDVDGFEETISAIESVERLSEDPAFGVGTRWRETRTMFGRQATEVMWVTAFDPGRSYVVNAASHGSEYTTTMSVIPIGDNSCEVTMGFEAKAVGTLAKIMAATVSRFFESATKKAFAQDLDDVAAAAEAEL